MRFSCCGGLLKYFIDAFDRFDLRHVMFEHIFNSIAKCNRARWTSRARTLHLKSDMPSLLIKVQKAHITAILLNKWPDSSLNNLLNHLDSFRIVILDGSIISNLGIFINNWLILCQMVGDNLEDIRLQDCPIEFLLLSHWDKVSAKENSGHSIYLEKSSSKRRDMCIPDRWKIHGLVSRHNLFPRDKLETARVRSWLRLYKQASYHFLIERSGHYLSLLR